MSWWGTARSERDTLPWRHLRSPWGVLLSETMLAQTQAARVAQRFPQLYRRYPDPRSLASSSLGSFLREWSGLGYNRRAVLLHAAATAILERHGGEVPCTLEDLLALPGVGSYTARAVLSFAFEKDVGVIDTNIGRVLARAFCDRTLSPRAAQAAADELVPPGGGRDWNLALMDLGSMICTSTPRCERCPLGDGLCAWRSAGSREDPAKGSSGVSRRQSTFQGSDRRGRGRLLRAACQGPIDGDQIALVTGFADDPNRAHRVAASLLAEGLLRRDERGALCLPS